MILFRSGWSLISDNGVFKSVWTPDHVSSTEENVGIVYFVDHDLVMMDTHNNTTRLSRPPTSSIAFCIAHFGRQRTVFALLLSF